MQLRYNLPVEMVYTLVPLFVIGVLFFYTARDQSFIEERNAGTSTSTSRSSASAGRGTSTTSTRTSTSPAMQVSATAAAIPKSEIPTLYLPVGQSIGSS